MRGHWEPAFSALFEDSRHPIAIIDDDRRIIDANLACAEFLGCSREDLAGRPARDFVPIAEHPDTDRDRELLIDAGTATGERTVLVARGQPVRVLYAARRLELPTGGANLYVVTEIESDEPDGENPLGAQPLTPREREIVRLVALGCTGDEIAGRLSLSAETVRTHVRNAMGKTGSRNRAHLVANALTKHLIEV